MARYFNDCMRRNRGVIVGGALSGAAMGSIVGYKAGGFEVAVNMALWGLLTFGLIGYAGQSLSCFGECSKSIGAIH